MEKLRLSDDQRRVLAFLIDSPPADRLGLLAATEYLTVVTEHIRNTLRSSPTNWETNDLTLMVTLAIKLKAGSSTFVNDVVFWQKVEAQLATIHPTLKAR
jgi:hypothetical protein